MLIEIITLNYFFIYHKSNLNYFTCEWSAVPIRGYKEESELFVISIERLNF